MIAQQTVELTDALIVEANEQRIVIQVNKDCHLNVIIPPGCVHDMKAGEVVPLLSIFRITRNGQIIQSPVQ